MPANYWLDVTHPGLAWDGMRLIDCIDSNSVREGVENICAGEWGWRVRQSGLTNVSTLLPNVLTVDGGDVYLVLLTGVRHVTHVAAIMDSVLAPHVRNLGAHMSNVADVGGRSLLELLGGAETFNGKRVIIYGHSYGSVIGCGFLWHLVNRGYGGDHGVVLVGGPRCLTADGWRAFDQNNFINYQNYDDTVPFVMPHSDEVGSFGLLYSQASRQRADELINGTTWRYINPSNGLYQESDRPRTLPGETVGNITWWAFGMDRFTGPRHGKSAYLNSFALYYNNYDFSTPRDTGVGAYGGGDTPDGDWGAGLTTPVMPTVNVMQGMTLTSSPPESLTPALNAQVSRRTRSKNIIVDGVVIGSDRRASVRRKIRLRYKSLKRLVHKADVVDRQALAKLVTTW